MKLMRNLGCNKGVRMSRKRYTTEQIIGMLREVGVELSRGQKAGHLCGSLGIREQTYYRWRREYGGMKVTQANFTTALTSRKRITLALSKAFACCCSATFLQIFKWTFPIIASWHRERKRRIVPISPAWAMSSSFEKE